MQHFVAAAPFRVACGLSTLYPAGYGEPPEEHPGNFIPGSAQGARGWEDYVSESTSFEMARAITTEYCKGCDPSGVQYALERVFIKHEAVLKEHNATIAGLRQALTEAKGALQALYEMQDGPPAKTTKKKWEQAMKRAEAALST